MRVRVVMKSVTIRIPEADLESIDEEASEHDVTRSEYIRTLIEYGREYDELKRERDRLDRELRQVIEHREEHTEIVEYVEEEQNYRQAPIWKRAKWWLKGMD